MILEGPWLNQLDNVIVRHGISLFRWRSEVVEQPTLCRLPFRAVTNFHA